MAKKNPLLTAAEPNVAQQVEHDRDRRTAKLAYDALSKQYKTALGKIDAQSKQISLLTELKKDRSKPKAYSAPKHKSKSDATAIVMFSDWHVGEIVKPDAVNGLNEYNPGIAEQRAKAVTERALMLLDHERGIANINSLIVCLGGDFITGWIHEENQQTNCMSPLAEVRLARRLISNSLQTFIEKSGCKTITIPTCIGNHGRTTKKMHSGNAAETNYEHNMYLDLRSMFSSLNWQVGESYTNYVFVNDMPLRFHHGEAIKFRGGANGIAIPFNNWIAGVNDSEHKAIFDFLGHHHQYWPGRNYCVNGSLIGRNAYGAKGGFKKQDPLQTFAICDHKRAITLTKALFTD